MKTVFGHNQTSPEAKVLAFIRATRQLDDNDRLVVAVSGGPDSVCLLSILARLQNDLKLVLYVAHLNHCLRGEDSDKDAEYVADLANRLGFPATIERRDVAAYQAQKHLSLEEAAREVRYAFLAELVAKTGSRAVAVGHTRDDNIETILMHMMRGSGVGGLRGLRPINELEIDGHRLSIVRPLLELTRAETVEYCNILGLAPRTDATNFELDPLRNRVRLELVPLLKSYNPRIGDALLRTAAIAADEIAFLETETDREWGRIAEQLPSAILLERSGLLKLPSSLQRHLLRRAVLKLSGTLKDFESGHVEDMLGMLDKRTGKRLELPGGLIFTVERDRFVIARDPASLCPLPQLEGESFLKVPGETLLPGWRVLAEIRTGSVDLHSADSFTAHVDFDKTGDRIVVRARRPGDLFQPLGMPRPIKVKDFMINTGIPVAWRGRVPLFVSDNGIIWVGGWRIDERMKVSPATEKVLVLRMERWYDD